MLKNLTKGDILLIIIIVLSIYGLFLVKRTKSFDEDSYAKEMGKLNNKIDSLKGKNEIINDRIMKIDSGIKVVDRQIIQTDKKINTIKHETIVKVNNVDNFNFSQLEGFFAERYGE